MPGSRGIMRRVAPYAALIFLWMLTSVGQTAPVDAQDAAETPKVSESSSRKPWLMVGLTPGGCSGGCRHVFAVIRKLSGNPNGLIVGFRECTPEYVMARDPEFIVLSPQGTPWCRYAGLEGVALQNFLWTLPWLAEELNIPILGICGGHQALALAFGGKVGPIRAGEFDCLPYSKGKQGGVVPLTVAAADPLFKGIDGKIHITQSHFDEVKVIPPGFVLLASEKHSPIQIMRHRSRPVYGIQGHPECFHKGHPEGGALLANFLEIAKNHNASARKPGSAPPGPLSSAYSQGDASRK
jgi:GMP synthase (glutamine-hydrolysing)